MNTCVVFFVILGCAFAQSPDTAAQILKQSSDVSPDGSYQWSYENDNGISAQESGALNTNLKEPSVEAQGQFQYTAPDGTPILVQYLANENGFQPQGAHFPVAPTPPPVPAYILRALEWNAAHPEQE